MFPDGEHTFTDAKRTFTNGKHTFSIVKHRFHRGEEMIMSQPGQLFLLGYQQLPA
jgi:hypothetical protein